MYQKFVYFISCWLLSVSLVFPKSVSEQFVASKLSSFASAKGLTFDEVQQILPFRYQGNTAFYTVNFKPAGWMLIAADDESEPIIAYSKEGNFVTTQLPESMQSWLNNYAGNILEPSVNSQRTTNPGWETAPEKSSATVKADVVEPLVQVKFNQSSPWNKYCPADNNGKAYVGCVAVAMAQAMTVPQYPDKSVGYFSYNCPPYGNLSIDYNNESAYNWGLILSGTDNRDEAARLLYHCGVSVKMEYSSTGSGTQTTYIPAALKTYYKYPNSVVSYSRGSYSGNWEDLIKNELYHGRAVVYSGNDGLGNPGHAFNLDGFDGNSMYHINWGWGGANNGYYSINNVKDGANDYTKNQQVVVGIRAPSVGPSDINISNLSVKENQPAGTVVGDITIDSEAVNPVYEFVLKGAFSIFLHDYMPSAFYVENGKLKTNTTFQLEDESIPVSVKVTNVANKMYYEKQFNIAIVASNTAINNPDDSEKNIFFSDNTIIYNGNVENVQFTLYTLSGSKALNLKLQKGQNSLAGFNLAPGYYILKTNEISFKPIKIFIH